MAESNNLKITALTCHVNHREELNNHFKKVLDAASALDVPVVTAVSGSPIPGKEEEDNFKEFSKVMGSLVEYATDKGIKIGAEEVVVDGE